MRNILILIMTMFAWAAKAQITMVNVSLETDEGAIIGLDDEMSANNVFQKEIVSGQHTLIIKYNDEVVKREVIDIPAGDSFNAEYPISGKVNIEASPKAFVIVDGNEVGQTPLSLDLLGMHNVKVRYANKKYKPVEESLNVLPMDNIERKYQLKKNKRPYKYSWFIAPQISFPTKKTSEGKFGAMVGRARVVGWYIKGTFGFSTIETEYSSAMAYIMWPTGKRNVSFWDACGGIMFNIVKPLYIYGGGGYGSFCVGYQDYNGKYYQSDEKAKEAEGFVTDFGLLFNTGMLTVNGGCSILNGNFIVNAGIGLKF